MASGSSSSGAAPPRTLLEFLSLPENAHAQLVVPLSWCPHLDEISSVKLPNPDVFSLACPDCEEKEEKWLCLSCHAVRCSRYVQEHMVIHAAESSHPLCLSLADLSVWCYPCESYVDHDETLYDVKNWAHKLKFNGQDMVRRKS